MLEKDCFDPPPLSPFLIQSHLMVRLLTCLDLGPRHKTARDKVIKLLMVENDIPCSYIFYALARSAVGWDGKTYNMGYGPLAASVSFP